LTHIFILAQKGQGGKPYSLVWPEDGRVPLKKRTRHNPPSVADYGSRNSGIHAAGRLASVMDRGKTAILSGKDSAEKAAAKLGVRAEELPV
jgi:hypothetical protein